MLTVLRVLAVWLLTRSHLWGWLEDVFGAAGDVWNAVKGFVRNIVSGVVDFFNTAIAFVWGELTRLGDALKAAGDFLWQCVLKAWGLANHLLQVIVPFLEDAINGAIGLAHSLVDDLGRVTWGFFEQTWKLISGVFDRAVQWVLDNVFNPLHDFALALFHDGQRALEALWNDVAKPAVDFVRGLVDGAVRWVSAAVHWVETVGSFIEDVVKKCWSWLVWFATHPFDYLVSLVTEAVHRGPRWFIDLVTGAVMHSSDRVEEMVARWLGE